MKPTLTSVFDPRRPGANQIKEATSVASDWHMNLASWSMFDFVLGLGAMLLAFDLSPSWVYMGSDQPKHATAGFAAALMGGTLLFTGLLFNLQLEVSRVGRLPFVLRCIGCAALATGIQIGLLYLIFYNQIGRWIIGQSIIYSTLGLYASRQIVAALGENSQRGLILIGTREFSDLINENVRRLRLPFRVVVTAELSGPSWRFHVLNEAAASGQAWEEFDWGKSGAQELLLERGTVLSPEISNLMKQFLMSGRQVSSGLAFSERYFQLIPVHLLDDLWLQQIDLRLTHPFYHRLKRVADILCSMAVGVIGLPVVFVAAFLIKLQDGGPMIYSQTRVGRLNQNFKMYKLRTMRFNSEKNGAVWAAKDDPRITPLGRFLRRTRVDELPQIWNVLSGEMSMIGPRPERPEFTTHLEKQIPFYGFRHLVKPGVTGWAQINYPYGASLTDTQRKLEFDLYYVKNAGLLLDTQIIVRTIATFMEGSR